MYDYFPGNEIKFYGMLDGFCEFEVDGMALLPPAPGAVAGRGRGGGARSTRGERDGRKSHETVGTCAEIHGRDQVGDGRWGGG